MPAGKFNLSKFNGLKKGFDKLKKVQDVDLQSDSLTFFAGRKTFVEFGGEGLEAEIDDAGNVTEITAGDIVSVKVVVQGKTTIELSDISVSAARIFDLVSSGNLKSAIDILLAENGSIVGNKFADRLFGGEGADKLYGLAGNDSLDGGTGDDLIDGGKGRDVLVGGDGADTFIFRKGYGSDTVLDFGKGDDLLDLRQARGISDFDDLMAHHIRETGDNIVIKGGQGIKIVLKDLDIAAIDQSDFLF